jgi:septal ring factor EnvC (AmiA/AmiB activator)
MRISGSCHFYLRLSLVLVLGVLLAPSLAQAKITDKLKQIEEQLLHQKERQATLDAKARQTGDNLNDLQKQLIVATEALQAKEEESAALDDRLDQLADDIDVKKASLKGERLKLNDLVAALLALSRQPPAATFLQTRLTDDYIHRTILLKAVLPRVQEQTEIIARDLEDLKDMQKQMGEQQKLVTASSENLRRQQYSLDQLIKARQGLLQRTDQQRDVIAKQLVSLTDEAKDLRELLAKVTPKLPSKNRHPEPTDDHAVLRQPVAGSLTHGFGVKDNDGVTSEGFTFAALSGSPIVAPRAGKVVFAGPFRGYGKILILQHDGGYHSFLAGFGRIDAEMGQEVAAGEPVGVMPVKTGPRPELYFEWRRNNEPVNPVGGFVLSKSP